MHDRLLKLHNHFNKVEDFLTTISGILVFLTMFLIVVNIFIRTLFDKPIAGVYEIVSFVFAAIVSFCLAYVQGEKENISVDVAVAKAPRKFKKLLELFGTFIGLVSIAIIAWFSIDQAISAFVGKDYQANSLLKLPLWPAKAVVGFGMLFLFIRLILDVFLVIFDVNQPYDQIENENGVTHL